MSLLNLSIPQIDRDLGYSQAIADAKATVRNSNAISDEAKSLLCLRLEELAKQYREELQNEKGLSK